MTNLTPHPQADILRAIADGHKEFLGCPCLVVADVFSDTPVKLTALEALKWIAAADYWKKNKNNNQTKTKNGQVSGWSFQRRQWCLLDG